MLPGLDGTGRLFGPLMASLPERIGRLALSYPEDRARSYSELASYVESEVRDMGQMVLLAESFSGPVAMELSGRLGHRLKGMVFCCTFCRAPLAASLPGAAALLGAIARIGIPRALLRAFMLNRAGQQDERLVDELALAIADVKPSVIAGRIKEVAKVDARQALRDCDTPVCIISASDDRVVSGRAAREMQGLIRDAEAHTVDGPHMLLQARPQACADIIAGFVGRIQGERAAL